MSNLNELIQLKNREAYNRFVSVTKLPPQMEITQKTLLSIYNSTHSIRLFITPDYIIKLFNQKANEIAISFYNKELKIGDCFKMYCRRTFNKIDCDLKGDFEKALQGDYIISEKEVKAFNSSLWFKIEYYPVYENDTLIGVSISARDISKRKYNEMFIEKQNQALRDIIFFESHEVRQPVTQILGLLQLLNKNDFSEQNKEIIGMFEKTTKKLEEITKTITEKCGNSSYYKEIKSSTKDRPELRLHK